MKEIRTWIGIVKARVRNCEGYSVNSPFVASLFVSVVVMNWLRKLMTRVVVKETFDKRTTTRQEFFFPVFPRVFQRCEFFDCTFSSGVIFQNVQFLDCEFVNCRFGDKDPAYLGNRTGFTGCSFLDCSILVEARDVKHVSFSRSHIRGGSVKRWHLTNIDFDDVRFETNFKEAVFVDCALKNVDFTGSDMNDSGFLNSDLTTTLLPLGDDQAWAVSGVLYLDQVLRPFKDDIPDYDDHIEFGKRTGGIDPSFVMLYDVESIMDELSLKSTETAKHILEKIATYG